MAIHESKHTIGLEVGETAILPRNTRVSRTKKGYLAVQDSASGERRESFHQNPPVFGFVHKGENGPEQSTIVIFPK